MSEPAAGSVAAPKKTPLFDQHQALGARLIDFGGWHMPVQYSSILEEHKTVREAVGLFDVSHMGEIFFEGPRAAEAVQRVTTNDISKIPDGGAQYNFTLREDAGIVDDCFVYKIKRDLYCVVVNASNIEKDFEHFKKYAGDIAEVANRSDDYGLLAIQGPKALAMMSEITGGIMAPARNTWVEAPFFGSTLGALPMARTGYTGEDGVEIFVPVGRLVETWDKLLETGAAFGIKPIGLGARDTLRLEARFCLYGNDIDETTNPVEAGLLWPVKGHGFVGEARLKEIQGAGVKRKLVGFKVLGRGIARHGYKIHAPAAGNPEEPGAIVGEVTSGTVAPTVGGAVGLGYVPLELAKPGTRLIVDCRGKPTVVEVVAGPFYKRAS